MNAEELFQATVNNFRREFVEDTRLEARDALRAVVASYDQALAERPDLPIPTPLMCAIEAARKVVA